MTNLQNYKIYLQWLEIENNVQLIIPAIKEDIKNKKLDVQHIDHLREIVIYKNSKKLNKDFKIC